MLQKITLGFIATFFLITAGVGVLSYVYPPDYAQKTDDLKDYQPPVNSTYQSDQPNSFTKSAPTASNKPAAANNKPSGGLTYAEIAKHNKPEDCYLAIKGIVYDVSYYANKHPGGQGVIGSNCGKEVTGLFASIHSNAAWNLLGKYKIGTVKSGEPPPANSPAPSTERENEEEWEDD